MHISEKDITLQISCTLLEMMKGSMRHVSFSRSILNEDGKTFREEHVKKDIEIKPGYSADTVLTFSKEGNHAYMGHIGDLHIKFIPDKHEKIKRKNDDLIITYKISLVDALLSN